MPPFTRRATAIIAISQATKQDIITFYHIPAEKIHVIYEAPAPHFRPQPEIVIQQVRAKYSLPQRYLLTVGTLEPRKNLVRLLSAFEHVHRQGLVDALVIVGAKGWLYDDFFRHLQSSPVRDSVILPGFVPDELLPALYAGATLFVLPSLYEGFGLPVLEAMACGVPVVASRAGALPEVGGEAAHYFDPTNVENMTQTIIDCLQDTQLRAAMREAGLRQAARFSWRRTARETAQVYAQLLEEEQ